MILPPPPGGAAFSEAAEGDMRGDEGARSSFSERLGIPAEWATVRQVHGVDVVRAWIPGSCGEADAIWTTVPGLPVGVFTADCFGVVLRAPDAAGVAHAGWRGTLAGIVRELVAEMTKHGHKPMKAMIGPGIGACCYEVGADVAERFPRDVASTRWNTPSVDLRKSIVRQLEAVEIWQSPACTYHDAGLFSHRVSDTRERMVAIGWVV